MWHIYSSGLWMHSNSGTIENKKSSAPLIVSSCWTPTIFRRLWIAADEMHNACLNNLEGKRRASSCVLLPNSTCSISSLSSTATGFSSRAKTTAIPITWVPRQSKETKVHVVPKPLWLGGKFLGHSVKNDLSEVITLRGCKIKILWKSERPRDMTHLMDFSLPYWKPYSRVKYVETALRDNKRNQPRNTHHQGSQPPEVPFLAFTGGGLEEGREEERIPSEATTVFTQFPYSFPAVVSSTWPQSRPVLLITTNDYNF